jgi:hypothetical protein
VPVFGGVCAKHDCCRLCRRACDVEDGLLVLRCLRRSARDVMWCFLEAMWYWFRPCVLRVRHLSRYVQLDKTV